MRIGWTYARETDDLLYEKGIPVQAEVKAYVIGPRGAKKSWFGNYENLYQLGDAAQMAHAELVHLRLSPEAREWAEGELRRFTEKPTAAQLRANEEWAKRIA